jgi:DNA-directed RNA polymerase specialized sigma24 family protein
MRMPIMNWLSKKAAPAEAIVDFGRAQTTIQVRRREAKMFSTKPVTRLESTRYATSADFCKIFQNDMNHLYLLAYLLTADRSIAEQCFVQGLEDARDGSPVFKEWANSWARRLLVVNAIRMLRPRPEGHPAAESPQHTIDATPAIAAILALNSFERFAFAMSVLERYSDRECSLLLECSLSDLVAARTRALQQIGNSTELRREIADIDSGKQTLSTDFSAVGPTIVSEACAASA